MRELKIGKTYKHFKGNFYKILDIVNDANSNENEQKKIVIYEALYEDHLKWAREYDEFASEVDREKHPNSTQKYRFEEID